MDGNWGCDGGDLDTAFAYSTDHGLASAASYPYQAIRDSCLAPAPPAVASRLANMTALPTNDEAAIYEALAGGPVAVFITIDDSWFDYASGVFSSPTCTGEPNHALVITGAGVDPESGAPYWILRNSFGPDW